MTQTSVTLTASEWEIVKASLTFTADMLNAEGMPAQDVYDTQKVYHAVARQVGYTE